jgi:hypothetical protein
MVEERVAHVERLQLELLKVLRQAVDERGCDQWLALHATMELAGVHALNLIAHGDPDAARARALAMAVSLATAITEPPADDAWAAVRAVANVLSKLLAQAVAGAGEPARAQAVTMLTTLMLQLTPTAGPVS